MFGRATIRLAIGPHSSFEIFCSRSSKSWQRCAVVSICPGKILQSNIAIIWTNTMQSIANIYCNTEKSIAIIAIL